MFEQPTRSRRLPTTSVREHQEPAANPKSLVAADLLLSKKDFAKHSNPQAVRTLTRELISPFACLISPSRLSMAPTARRAQYGLNIAIKDHKSVHYNFSFVFNREVDGVCYEALGVSFLMQPASPRNIGARCDNHSGP
jgi:hypothetical protein